MACAAAAEIIHSLPNGRQALKYFTSKSSSSLRISQHGKELAKQLEDSWYIFDMKRELVHIGDNRQNVHEEIKFKLHLKDEENRSPGWKDCIWWLEDVRRWINHEEPCMPWSFPEQHKWETERLWKMWQLLPNIW